MGGAVRSFLDGLALGGLTGICVSFLQMEHLGEVSLPGARWSFSVPSVAFCEKSVFS
jgi:hypothetical protein